MFWAVPTLCFLRSPDSSERPMVRGEMSTVRSFIAQASEYKFVIQCFGKQA